jgi:hypothetical protein
MHIIKPKLKDVVYAVKINEIIKIGGKSQHISSKKI